MKVDFKIRRLKIETITIPKKFFKTPPSKNKLKYKNKYPGIIIVDNERKLIDGYATFKAMEDLGAKKIKCFILNKHFGAVLSKEAKIYTQEFKKEWYTLLIEEEK